MKTLDRPLHRCAPAGPRRGTSLFLAVVLIVGLAGFAAALAGLTGSGFLESRAAREEAQAFQLCEAGLSEAWATLDSIGEQEARERFVDPVVIGPHTVDVDVTFGQDDPVLAATRVRIVATASAGTTTASTALIAERIPNGEYRHALFAYQEAILESNTRIDSYNSNYGVYDPDDPGVLADVGTNGDVTLNSNIELYGGILYGPEGNLYDSAPNTMVYGVMEPAEELEEILEIPVPSIPQGPPEVISGGTSTIGPGDIGFKRISVQTGATLRIEGPARIVLEDLQVRSNANLILDPSAGPIEIHCTEDVSLQSNSNISTVGDVARDMLLNIAWQPGDDHEVVLASNGDFVGVINAPYSNLEINSNFNIYGGMRADYITLESNSQIHFDEDLLFEDGVEIEHRIVTWTRGNLGTN